MTIARWMALGLSVMAMSAACSPDPAEAGRGAVPRLDEHRYLGEPVTVENVTVWPVFTDSPLDIGEFLTLEEAQARGLAQVRELGGAAAQPGLGQVAAVNERQEQVSPPGDNGSGGLDNGSSALTGQAQQSAQAFFNDRELSPDEDRIGSLDQIADGGAAVGTLEIVNDSDLAILVCAGTVVKGGNQDRQIGQDFIITAHSKVPVDAFCVEQGRWTATRAGQATGGQFVATGVVAAKGVRASAQYAKNQSAVWENVGLANAALGKSPRTSTFLASIEDDDPEVLERRQRVEEALRAALTSEGRDPAGAPVGFAYAVNGEPVTVRTFAHPRILRAQLPAFLKTMTIEAEIGRRELGDSPLPTCSAEDILDMVQGINQAREEVLATRASNFNGYRQNDFGGNANCYLEIPVEGSDGRTRRVAASQDWTAK
jgi:hypothetical protein